jgi:hypothetical protein
MTMKLKTIPQSVLNVLGVRWGTDGRHYERRSPRYLYRHDDSPNRINNGLKHSEVRALVADGVLANDWRGDGDAIAILEHEQHALCDFCSEVYDAWGRLQGRLEMARHRQTAA